MPRRRIQRSDRDVHIDAHERLDFVVVLNVR
jgi:hypothetical protein